MEKVNIPEEAQPKIMELLNLRNLAEVQLQAYMQGLQHGLGLKGNWNLDMKNWLLMPIEQNENTEKLE